MATVSEVRTALTTVAQEILSQKKVLEKAQTAATNAKSVLQGLATVHSDVISTVQGYTDTGNTYEVSMKAEFALLNSERTTLISAADSIIAISV